MLFRRYLVLISGTTQTCGVEEFSRILATKLGGRAKRYILKLDVFNLLKEMRSFDAVVLNFPVVAWKKKLIEPFLAVLAARAAGKEVIVVLHEWEALNWKRRLVLVPVLALATQIFFSAPEIVEEFEKTRLARFSTSKRDTLPIPPNLVPPERTLPSAFSKKLKRERERGKLILGQFGSIYPQKQVTTALSVAAELQNRDVDVFVAFVGSFIKGQDNVERDFFNAVTDLNLTDQVAVSGFVESADELFAIFHEIDVFCYLLPGGLTSRRASTLTAAASGNPVVVNAPQSDDSFAHHQLFQQLIKNGGIQFVPTDASIIDTTDAVQTAMKAGITATEFKKETEALWDDVIAGFDGKSSRR